ncbi:10688_t:CDS:2 [Scutellospora calospora]|uniref:10688_t:CDS:1 n=1 Tax=Scutellospora calospora TaxID=85575 RepID=A0ACA9KWI7_9GLOM|nr:10688_t:CDS:2 [Scutellospora calospora]
MDAIPQTQDLPRPGGFPSVRYKRNLPQRGPSGLVIFTVIGAISAFGFYRIGQGNLEKRELHREKLWSRIHLIPLLTAELDRDTYRRNQAALEREAEIMKDVPGWKVGESVYNTKRYVGPTQIVVPEQS